jgi:hypothetical protein
VLGSEGLPRTVIAAVGRTGGARGCVVAGAVRHRLVAAATMYNDAVAAGGLHRAIRDAPPAETALVARATVPLQWLPEIDALVVSRLADALGETAGQSTGSSVAPRSSCRPRPGRGQPRDGPRQYRRSPSTPRSSTAAGRRGPGPGRAVLSTGAAASLGRRMRDRVHVSDALDRARRGRRDRGTYEPHRADPYWLGDPLELDGERTTTTFTGARPGRRRAGDLIAGWVARCRRSGGRCLRSTRLTVDATTTWPPGRRRSGRPAGRGARRGIRRHRHDQPAGRAGPARRRRVSVSRSSVTM